jgi:phosphatidylethanolamine-binding protein (PEBP) family uncharacterized protein
VPGVGSFPAHLSVILGDGSAAAGQVFTADAPAIRTEPRTSWEPAPGAFYTLMCIDPDAVAPVWLHMLITNIEGGSSAAGETLVPWAPPTPPSGTHRYYMCLFEHAAATILTAPKGRGYFKPTEYIRAAGLRPVAAAMWRVRAA